MSGDRPDRPPLAAVLFDMDGTLVDTERESGQTLTEVFRERYGVELGPAALDEILGAAWADAIEHLHGRHDLVEPDPEGLKAALLQAKERILADNLKILPAAGASIRAAAQAWPVAVITGSWRAEAVYALAEIGVSDAVQFIVGSDDVDNGKPSPEGYLAAAAQLGVAPQACIVLEDSVRGVQSAHAAGAFVVGIRVGSFTPDELAPAGAHIVIDSLESLVDPGSFQAIYGLGKT